MKMILAFTLKKLRLMQKKNGFLIKNVYFIISKVISEFLFSRYIKKE